MAAKAHMLKLLQDIRGFAELDKRQPLPRSPMIALPAPRAIAPPSRLRPRKLNIAIDVQPETDVPDQVRIIHLKPAAPSAVTLPTPAKPRMLRHAVPLV